MRWNQPISLRFGTRRGWERAALLLVALAAAWVTFRTARLAPVRFFAIDEFQYAHAAWLVARGEVPYRDFFEFHHPLLYQALSVAFRFLGDDPRAIAPLRLLVLPVVLAGAALAALANRASGTTAALATFVVVLSIPDLVDRGIEIRPDLLAAVLFLGALVLLRTEGIAARRRAFGAGALFTLALWASQKVGYYGAILPAAWLFDLWRVRRGRPARLVASPGFFAGGVAVVVAGVAAYLAATRSAADWFEWCVAWAIHHEANYPGFSWRDAFDPLLASQWWLFLLAAAGLAATAFRWRRRCAGEGDGAARSGDLLLAAALVSTFLAYRATRAPFVYNLVPFLLLLGLWAGRGIAAIASALPAGGVRGAAAALALAVAAFGLVASDETLRLRTTETNRAQLEALGTLGRLTAPTDPVYDNSGSFVARPHVGFYFCTNSMMRSYWGERLSREVPEAIVADGCTALFVDARFASLPIPLQQFLFENFHRYDADIRLWGRRFAADGPGPIEGEFRAVVDGRYFVEPASALEGGTLRVDGVPVAGAEFPLARGVRTIRYDGPAREFHILWLPRDGRRWSPAPGRFGRVSRIL